MPRLALLVFVLLGLAFAKPGDGLAALMTPNAPLATASSIADARAQAQALANGPRGPRWTFHSYTWTPRTKGVVVDFYRDSGAVRWHKNVVLRLQGDRHRLVAVSKATKACNLKRPAKPRRLRDRRTGKVVVDYAMCGFKLHKR
jgi:hypothetical protein